MACERFPGGLSEVFQLPSSKEVQKTLFGETFYKEASRIESPETFQQGIKTWRRIVSNFFSCASPTSASNKIIVVSALARKCQALMGGDMSYLIGLWRQDIASKLLQQVDRKQRIPGQDGYRALT